MPDVISSRVYAVSSKNRILTTYIVALGLARLVISLTWAGVGGIAFLQMIEVMYPLHDCRCL